MSGNKPINVEFGYSMFDHSSFIATLRSTDRNTYNNTQAILQSQAATLRQQKDQQKQNVYLHNAALQQMNHLMKANEKGFDSIVNKLESVEANLGRHLYEVRWILAHIEGTLYEFIDLFKNKRQTEAHELVRDGNKALAVNRLEDAENCLLKAIELKRTDYKAHLTLGITYQQMKEKDKAIDEFNKCIDYAADANEKVFAMLALADSFTLFENYESAIIILRAVIEFKQANGLSATADIYQMAVNHVLANNENEAVTLLLDVFQADPAYCQPALLDPRLVGVHEALVKRVADRSRELEKAIVEKIQLVQREMTNVDSSEWQAALNNPQLGRQLSTWIHLAEQALESKSYSSLFWANEFMFYVAGGASSLSEIVECNENIKKKETLRQLQSENVKRWQVLWYRYPQLRFLPSLLLILFSFLVLSKGFSKIPTHWQITSHKFFSVLFYYPVVIFLTLFISALLLWLAYRLFRYMDKRWMEKLKETPPLAESKQMLAQTEQEIAAENQQMDYLRSLLKNTFDEEVGSFGKKLQQDLGLEKPTVTTEQSKNSCTLRMFMSSMLIDEPAPNDPWPLTRAKATDFLQHFLDVPFTCDRPVRFIVIRGGKNNLPQHSYANGLLYSQTEDEIRHSGEWPEPIGTIEFQYGGRMTKPLIQVRFI